MKYQFYLFLLVSFLLRYDAHSSLFVEPFTSALTNENPGYSIGFGTQIGLSTSLQSKFGGNLSLGVQGVKILGKGSKSLNHILLETWLQISEKNMLSLGGGGASFDGESGSLVSLGYHYCFVCGVYAEYGPQLSWRDAFKRVFIRFQQAELENQRFNQLQLGLGFLL